MHVGKLPIFKQQVQAQQCRLQRDIGWTMLIQVIQKNLFCNGDSSQLITVSGWETKIMMQCEKCLILGGTEERTVICKLNCDTPKYSPCLHQRQASNCYILLLQVALLMVAEKSDSRHVRHAFRGSPGSGAL